MEKFLLCRPQGGLNDMLCRIKACYDYALKFKRTLVIDTLTRTYLSTNFGNIFELNDSKVITNVDLALLKRLSNLNNFSYFLEKKYIHSNNFNQPVEALDFETNKNIDWHNVYKFDLTKDYEHSVLYYQMYGGGQDSYLLFKHNIISHINKKITRYVLSLIPTEEYEAVHIRYTDLRAENYFDFLKKIKPQLSNKKVLICSDNNQVKQACIDFLGKNTAFSITDIPESNLGNGDALHTIHSIKTFDKELDLFSKLKDKYYPFERDDFNIQTVNSIVDFLGLIFSSKIYFPQITSKQRHNKILCKYNFKQNKISGYSQLALNIQKDRRLIANLKQC